MNRKPRARKPVNRKEPAKPEAADSEADTGVFTPVNTDMVSDTAPTEPVKRDTHHFVRWFILAAAMSVCAYFGYKTGLFGLIIRSDKSFLSVAISLLFIGGTIYAGWLSRAVDKVSGAEPVMFRPLKLLNYLSDVFFVLGLLGTIVGFCMSMIPALSGTQDVQSVINSLKIGVSTALYTTLTGLVASLLLQLQIFLIDFYHHEK